MKSFFFFLVGLIFSQTVKGQFFVDTTLPDLIPYRKGNYWGYCDKDKKIIISPQFHNVNLFHNSYAEVWFDTSSRGAIDKNGKIVMRSGKDTVVYVSDAGRVYKYLNDTIFSIIEPSGNHFVPIRYQIHWAFTSSSYVAKKRGKYGVINNKESIVIPFKFTEIGYPDSRNYVWINIKGKQGYVDTLGKLIIPLFPKKYSVLDFKNDRALIYKKGSYNSPRGFIDRTGKTTIPLIYKSASDFVNNLSVVSNGYRYGAINQSGDTVIPFKYGSIANYKEGRLPDFILGKECGILDFNGNEIFKTNGKKAEYITDDLIIVEKLDSMNKWNSFYGIMNRLGKLILPIKFRRIYYEGFGLFYVVENANKSY